MYNEISYAFKKAFKEGRPALLSYTVAGDDTKRNSLEILKTLSLQVDICELGFAHNTPIADGGAIQDSSNRAIKNGIKINDVFKIVKDFKKTKNSKPIILMGYYNMIYQFGESKFLNSCKKSGVNGLIVVDLPWPENKSFSKKCKIKKINFVQLISPTTTIKRLKNIIKDSHGMLYYISMLSTTGGKLKLSPKTILKNYKKVKTFCRDKNCIIGFGITTKSIKMFKNTDGVVVGSEICKEISRSISKRQKIVTNVDKLVKKLRKQIV